MTTLITCYLEADWIGSSNDWPSTTRYCMFVGGNLVTWQKEATVIVTRSSNEADYWVMAHMTFEVLWLKTLSVHALPFPLTTSILMSCDKQAAIHMSSKLAFHECTKHIEVDYHLIREQTYKGSFVCNILQM